jgi:hypothetical protein
MFIVKGVKGSIHGLFMEFVLTLGPDALRKTMEMSDIISCI